MGLARTWSVALLGVDGRIVEIEADVGGGLPRFQLVGLPDAALHEAKDRIRAAITNSGRTWPNERIVLALSPASLRKTGSGFDLAIADLLYFYMWTVAPPSTPASAVTERAPGSVSNGSKPIAESSATISASPSLRSTPTTICPRTPASRDPATRRCWSRCAAVRSTSCWSGIPTGCTARPWNWRTGSTPPRSTASPCTPSRPAPSTWPPRQGAWSPVSWARSLDTRSSTQSNGSSAAKAQAAAAGRYRGGRRPFGYESDGVTVRPAEAAIVADASDRVLAGESLHSVARDLNARGVVTSTGGAWKPTELRGMLLRARNAGIVEHNGHEVGPAEWEPIVDSAVWRNLRRLLTAEGRRPRSLDHRWLGSGLYLCGVCADGTTMLSASARTGAGRSVPSYRCRNGNHLTRVAQPLDDLVTALVIERLSDRMPGCC